MTASGMRRAMLLAALVCVAALGTRAGAAPGAAVGVLASTRLYDNTGNPANTYYAAQGGAEAIDDLHLVSAGSLDTLVFEYYDPAVGGTFSATVRVYGNPGGLDLDTTPLGGPYVVTALPRGRKTVAVPLPQSLLVDASLWVGVQFTSTTAGLIINSVPSRGSSHDLYLENGGFYWFGGNPEANFGLRLMGTAGVLSIGGGPETARTALAQPRPNPFRNGTTLGFTIDRRGLVRLDVLDVSGRRVCTLVNTVREAGSYTESWSGQDDAGRVQKAGVYFVRLEAGVRVAIRRIVLTP